MGSCLRDAAFLICTWPDRPETTGPGPQMARETLEKPIYYKALEILHVKDALRSIRSIFLIIATFALAAGRCGRASQEPAGQSA